jgi:hypothetical protein
MNLATWGQNTGGGGGARGGGVTRGELGYPRTEHKGGKGGGDSQGMTLATWGQNPGGLRGGVEAGRRGSESNAVEADMAAAMLGASSSVTALLRVDWTNTSGRGCTSIPKSAAPPPKGAAPTTPAQ